MKNTRFPSVRRLAGGSLFLATLGLAGCGGPPADEEAAPSRPGGGRGGFGAGGNAGGGGSGTAVPVEVVEIETGAISAFIETNGTLEAEREVDIVARMGGPLVGLRTEEGRRVRAGDLLAQLDEAEPRAQVEISRVALQQAELAWNRAEASFENQVVSQEVYDSALSTFESARAQLEGSEIQLGYTRIEAPFDGLIIERAVKLGETVTAGQRLFRISDFDPLLCQIGVPERDLTRLSVGQPAIIEVEAFPGVEFRGRVLRVSPVVDAATGTIRVTLEVDRQGRLSPGMFATVRLVTDVRENALIMPKRALSLESLADSVFVVEDGIAYRRNVTLGYEEEERVEVTSGLSANDRVIVIGQDGLTDATPVQILVGPGAEEASPRRAAAGAGGAMTEERREAIRERMRARGMTDQQIAARLAAMAAGGGPPRARSGGRPAAGAAPDSVPAAPSEAPGEPPPRPPAEAGRAGRSFADLSPEAQADIRARLRAMGMTEEQIEERVLRGWGPGPPGEASPEQLEALRERLRRQGLSETQIEERLARRRSRR